jgi:hypothetical protein
LATDLKVFKAKGIRRSWLAEVQGLGKLACIHKEWLQAGHYKEQILSGEKADPRSKKRQEFIEAIREAGIVVLTNDNVVKGPKGLVFERADYLSIWRVTNFLVHEDGLIELDRSVPLVALRMAGDQADSQSALSSDR